VAAVDTDQTRAQNRNTRRVCAVRWHVPFWHTNVADNIYTRLLARAIDIEGSSQSLAARLRVPEATLIRWRSGRALMPVRAFQMLLSYVAEVEARGINDELPSQSQAGDATERLTFPIGKLFARCARCDGIEFRRATPGAPLKMTSTLLCCSCGEEVIHGNLLARLGDDVIAHKTAEGRARIRRRSKPTTLSSTARQAAKPEDKT
jgi:hypothetical protein